MARVREAVEDLQKCVHADCRFLITARPYAYPEGSAASQGRYLIADLNPEQSGLFIQRWYEAVVQRLSDIDGERMTADLLRVLEREDLKSIVSNPLLLTLTATLHTNATKLPDDRVDLYNDVIDLLLQRWKQDGMAEESLNKQLQEVGTSFSRVREKLALVAFEAHEGNIGKQGMADIGEFELQQAFEGLTRSKDRAISVVKYIAERTGLLLEQGVRKRQRQFTFPHRTFQEFMAAEYLASKSDFDKQVLNLAKDLESIEHWREVFKLAARIAKAERGADVADALVQRDYPDRHFKDTRSQIADEPDLTWQRAILAAEQLIEIKLEAVRDERPKALQHVAEWLAELVQHGRLSIEQRAYTGRLLAQLGDPRKGVGTLKNGLPDIEWIEIPAGEFIFGDKSESNGPIKIHLDAFKISKYPITYAQFQAFINAKDGWHDAKWWKALSADREHKSASADQRFRYANHPREDVSWYDVMAYCRWVSAKLGLEITLPTEQQWEKAARGTDGRIYPWGKGYRVGYANIDETEDKAGPSYLRTTTSVGMYPQGASPFGALDMSGNVWEWCLNEYRNPKRFQPEGTNERVVRGGSWLNLQNLARCAYRDFWNPGYRDFYLGFRIVCVPAFS